MVDILNKTKETSIKTRKMYVSTPFNRLQSIESQLDRIFKEELNSKNSILVSYKQEIISKLARYLSGQINRPASIGIAGETASGKSTITLDIIDTIKSFATEFGVTEPNVDSNVLEFINPVPTPVSQ